MAEPAGRRVYPGCAGKRGSVVADVLVRQGRVGGDRVAQEADALRRLEVDDLDLAVLEPGGAAGAVDRLAHHHGADLELAAQAAAVPAGREGPYHHRVAVTALPSGLPEGVGLGMYRGVVLLHPPVVPPAEEEPIAVEEGGADRDP